LEDVFRELVRLNPAYAGIVHAALLPDGMRWPAADGAPRAAAALRAATAGTPAAAPDGLWVLSGAVLFQHGSLGQRSELLARLARGAEAALHPAEAEALGLQAGDELELMTESGRLALPFILDDGVPRGAVFVPYAYAGVELNRLGMPEGPGLRARARRVAGARAGAPATS
jgi:predicted molibdopterin-dependent oxidoreductase YjgC